MRLQRTPEPSKWTPDTRGVSQAHYYTIEPYALVWNAKGKDNYRRGSVEAASPKTSQNGSHAPFDQQQPTPTAQLHPPPPPHDPAATTTTTTTTTNHQPP